MTSMFDVLLCSAMFDYVLLSYYYIGFLLCFPLFLVLSYVVLLFASSIFNFDGASETWHPEYRGPLGPQTLMPTHIIFTENQKSDDPDQRRIHSKLTRYSMGRTIGLSFLE